MHKCSDSCETTHSVKASYGGDIVQTLVGLCILLYVVNILLGPHKDYNAQPHSKVYVKELSTVLGCVYARVRLHVILDSM